VNEWILTSDALFPLSLDAYKYAFGYNPEKVYLYIGIWVDPIHFTWFPVPGCQTFFLLAGIMISRQPSWN
jgi:hypothetical protein